MAEVKQVFDGDFNGLIGGLEKTANLAVSVEGKLSALGQAQKQAFSSSEKAVIDFNRQLSDGTKIYQKIENSAEGFRKEQERLNKMYAELRKSQKQFIAEGRYEELQQNIAGVKSRIKELGGELENVPKNTKKAETGFGKLGAMVASVFAVGMIVDWARQIGESILNVTAEFQKFEAVLTTSLGSGSAAERAMLMIQDFAASTPFSVQELTDAYVKLAGRGIRATNTELTALGDLAASTGKSFDQLTEAVLDAMSGENERLKEFGIQAKKTGDTTQYTFKGVTTEVKNSDEAIKEYLISLGQVEGVTGSMASISETLTGKMSNLGDAIDNMFLTIGQQETGVMASFISFLSEAVEYTTFLLANTDQLAKKQAAGAIADYATKTETDFKKIAESAKASGQDVEQALAQQNAAMRAQLEDQLKLAERQSKAIEEKNGGFLSKLAKFGIGGGVQYNIDKSLEAGIKASEQEIRGKLAALDDAQRFVLEDLQKKENQSAAERAEAAKKAAEEAAKKEAAARKKALADLYKELEALQKAADKAKLDMMNKNSEAYLKAVLDRELQEVEALEKALIEKEKLAGKDGKLAEEQILQLNILAQAATKKYYDDLSKLKQQQEDKILDLQKESDEKAMAQLVRKYDAEIRAAEEAGQKEVVVALKAAKAREQAKLGLSQKLSNLDSGEALATEFTKSNISTDAGLTEAGRAEALERAKQQALLDIQIEFAEKRLKLLEGELDEDSRLRYLQVQNTLNELKGQKEKAQKEDSQFSFAKLMGISEEEAETVKEYGAQILGQFSDYLAQTVELKQREVESLTRAIDEKGQEIDREIAINKDGFASNIAQKQQEYEELKQQREKAQKEQQQAQRRQLLLDTVMQASNLITSSTEIFKTLSPIPFVGVPLAIGLIATMFGAFVAAKSKAVQASKVPTYAKGGEGKLIHGPSHAQGGIDLIENHSGRRIANIEGGENFYVTNKKSTAKWWPFLEAINADNESAFAQLSIERLLDGTGVRPASDLPKKTKEMQLKHAQRRTDGLGEIYLQKMNQHLSQMESDLKGLYSASKNEVFETASHKVYKSGTRTRKVKK